MLPASDEKKQSRFFPFSIRGRKSSVTRRVPTVLVFRVERNPARVSSLMIPAQFTRISTLPHMSAVLRTASLTDSVFPTSSVIQVTDPGISP